MRVIAGSARRLQLKTVEGMDTRPTTDRIKETLFNILNPYISGTTFLDLFSGSGAIAIEALSRGAQKAYLVETNKKAVTCIKDNLEHTKFSQQAEVMMMDALSAIRMLNSRSIVFDYIYMDPPYRKEMEKEVLQELAHSSIVGEDTEIIVEAALHTDFSYLEELPFQVLRVKEYKTNQHVFIQRKA